MSRSYSITPADFKINYTIRVILLFIWGGLIVFGIITFLQPDWLSDISKMGKESEAMDLKKMGDDLMTDGNFYGAISLFQKALDRNPELYEALGNIAISYTRLGDTDKAEKTFKKMIKLIPERDYISYYNLGEIYKDKDKEDYQIAKEDYQIAREYYQQSLLTHPFPEEAYKLAGFCSQQLGDLELALQYYNQAISKISDFEQLYRGSLQRDHFRLKKDAEAFQQVEDLMAVDDATEILAKYDEKILHYIQNSNPENSKIYYKMGLIFQDLGNVEMAKRAFRNALNINPKNTYAKNDLRHISQK